MKKAMDVISKSKILAGNPRHLYSLCNYDSLPERSGVFIYGYILGVYSATVYYFSVCAAYLYGRIFRKWRNKQIRRVKILMGEMAQRTKDIPVLYKRKEECCGCTACYAICPKSAISMIEDEEGFEYPQIDEEKCIRCNQCLKVCSFKATEE